MKKIVKDIIDEIKKDENTIKPNIVYHYKRHQIEVVYVGKSNFNKYFKQNEITHQYLFDSKSKNHLLFVFEESFDKYRQLYSEITILSTLRLFVNRKKTNKIIKSIAYLSIISLILFNIIILIANDIKKIFYIPITSLLFIVLIYIAFSRLMDDLYIKDRARTKQLLHEKFDKLKEEQQRDVYIKIKDRK